MRPVLFTILGFDVQAYGLSKALGDESSAEAAPRGRAGGAGASAAGWRRRAGIRAQSRRARSAC